MEVCERAHHVAWAGWSEQDRSSHTEHRQSAWNTVQAALVQVQVYAHKPFAASVLLLTMSDFAGAAYTEAISQSVPPPKCCKRLLARRNAIKINVDFQWDQLCRPIQPTAGLSGIAFAGGGAAIMIERYVAGEGLGAEALVIR